MPHPLSFQMQQQTSLSAQQLLLIPSVLCGPSIESGTNPFGIAWLMERLFWITKVAWPTGCANV